MFGSIKINELALAIEDFAGWPDFQRATSHDLNSSISRRDCGRSEGKFEMSNTNKIKTLTNAARIWVFGTPNPFLILGGYID
jgi:hypothetical protein